MTISTKRIITASAESTRLLPRHDSERVQIVLVQIDIMAVGAAVAVGAFAQVMVHAEVETADFLDGFFVVN